MDYRQSLGSSISGRDRQQSPIKVKKHHDITKQSKNKIFKITVLILEDHLHIAKKNTSH